MPLHDAEAIILRNYPLSEADRIIVLFTREFGKVRAVARGVRKPRSRMAAALEPLSHISLQFYQKQGQELCHIRQCEMIRSYLGKDTSPLALHAYSYMAEIVHEFVQENHTNELLFRLLLSVLNAATTAGVNQSLIRYFEFWSLRLNGVLSDYEYCSRCRKCVREDGFIAAIKEGLCLCMSCAAGSGTRVGSKAIEVLSRLRVTSPRDFAAEELPPDVQRELSILARRLLEFHLEKRLKSIEPLRQIMGSAF